MTDNPQLFDAIVVGSGMSGGWAAKEFCEKGFKTLVLERGRNIEAGTDYVGENSAPWDHKFRDQLTPEMKVKNPIQTNCYAYKESTEQFFAKDSENPYSHEDDKPFIWIRGDQVGGKSLLWARQTYRWSELDFEANKKDGHGVDWPIRYKDIAPWYDYVERFVGVSGSKEGLSQLPDGEFQPPMEMNCVEKDMKEKIDNHFDDRTLIIGRTAHLTEPTQEQLSLGRGKCQFRNQCQRGCSFGAYFSSVSATLPAAKRTGNLTLISDAHVTSIIYDEESGKASGVQVINRKTNERTIYNAKVIFLCASTLGTNQILLNSKSASMPNGIVNSSGTLGHYIMDHHMRAGARGIHLGFQDKYYKGRRPTGLYIPRFRNLNDDNEQDYLRGFGYQGSISRALWPEQGENKGIGASFKEEMRKPGPWNMTLYGFGETLPYKENRVTLHPTKTDKWDVPQVHLDVGFSENELKMRKDMVASAMEIMRVAGFIDIEPMDRDGVPGMVIHEMGGAVMGRDPKTSILNSHNQCHDVPNIFVTDGAAMASSACQNPSLTYMALTARAVDFAVTQMKAGLL